MIGPEAAAKAVAAVAAAAIALVVAAPRAGGRSAKSLGAFLVLIAANQAMEGWRAAQLEPDHVLARAAAVVASLDPLVLLVFAASLPGVASMPRWVFPAVAAGSATFALWGGWALPPRSLEGEAYALLLNVFTFAVYSGILARIASGARAEPALRPLVVAMAIAAIPVGQRTVDTVVAVYFLAVPSTTPYGHVFSIIGAATVVGLHSRSLVRRAGARWRDLAPGIVVSALLVLFPIVDMLAILGAPVDPMPFHVLGRAGAALRWMLFGVLASVAIVREDMLGFGLAQRRRAARVLIATGVFAILAITLSIVGLFVDDAVAFRPLDLMIVLAILGLTQGFQGFTDRVAKAAYGLPIPAARDAQGHYREAARRVVARGGDPAEDAVLATLRGELKLDGATVAVIHRLAEEDAPARLVPGSLLAGRYRIERPVVGGAAGRAFLARDELMMRDVVLKEVVSRKGEREAERLRDARLASAFQHPNLVTVFNVLRRGGTTLVVQESPGGGTLEERLAAGPVLELVAIGLVESMLAGLAALHGSGIVHGDVRAANVVLGRDGSAKLVDFGLSAGSRESDVRQLALLARELVPTERARHSGVIERALRGELADARAMLEAWRSASEPRSEAAREGGGDGNAFTAPSRSSSGP